MRCTDAPDDFFDHLGVAGRVEVVHAVARGGAVSGFDDAVAVAVVDEGDNGAVHALQAILEIVGERVAASGQSVAVAIVCLS